MKPVCLVVGAGAGIGGHTGKKFAAEGYFSCLCRRSDSKGLETIVDEIKQDGFEAKGFMLDATQNETIENLITEVEQTIGPIEVAIYNLGAQIGDKPLDETSQKQFELGWRLGTFGLFRLASSLFPKMVAREKGTLIVTSSTAAVRGNGGQHSHAAAMGGRRMLCQTLNAEFSPKNIHVAHVIIDGAVDAPDTLGKMLGPTKFQKLREEIGLENDGLLLPEKVADTYYHIAQQHRSAWAHEIDLRSFSDTPWWNR